jgi:alpha-beta hydrolase superfamily lysophospholipase
MLRHCLYPLLAVCLALAGCAPWVNRPGPPVAEPRLARGYFSTSDGAVLPVRSWLPKSGALKAVILALHGFNDYSRAFELPGRYLSERGIAVYAYDQRGFGKAPGRGLWAGNAAYARDLAEFAGQLRRRCGKIPLYLLGESMGGAVVLVALAGDRPLPVDGAILSAPAVWSRDSMPWYQRALLAVTVHTLPWLELTGSSLQIQASDNIEVLRGMGRDPLIIKATRVDAVAGLADLMDEAQQDAAKLGKPALVLYGEKDEVIPKAPIQTMLAKLPKAAAARVGFYPQGYHLLLRDLHAERPWEDIAAWVADRDRPLPSGADQRAAALASPGVGKPSAWTGSGGGSGAGLR